MAPNARPWPRRQNRQVYSFDGRWREAEPLPRALYNHAAVTLSNRLYVLGGYDTEGEELRSVYVLDGGRWRPAPSLPRAVHAFGAVAFRGELWVIGGRRGEEKLREVWIFDPERGRWRAGPSLPKAMELLGAAVVGDQIHASGSGRTRSTTRARAAGATARPPRAAPRALALQRGRDAVRGRRLHAAAARHGRRRKKASGVISPLNGLGPFSRSRRRRREAANVCDAARRRSRRPAPHGRGKS